MHFLGISYVQTQYNCIGIDMLDRQLHFREEEVGTGGQSVQQ